jgi:hypothetical protein
VSEEKLNVHQRLARAMEEVTYVQKEKKQGMRYSIVTHDVVTAKVRPVLLKHGVVYYPSRLTHSQNGNRTEVELDVTFVSTDDPTDKFTVPSLGYGLDDQDKGPGKAISYAVKYALLKALGLETGDDPDEDQVTKHESDRFLAAPNESGPAAEPKRRGRPAKAKAEPAAPVVEDAYQLMQAINAMTKETLSQVRDRILASKESLEVGMLDSLRSEYRARKEQLGVA